MFHRFRLVLPLLFVLSACLPAPALTPVPPAPVRGSPTGRGESTPTPAPTETPTPTPTPAPPEHPSAFDAAFERGVIVFQDGQWLARVTFTGENGQEQQASYAILPDTFNANDELRARNPLAPLAVRALSPLPPGEGPGVREVTLLWTGKEFRLAPALPAVFEGVNTDAPRFNPEAYAGIPRFAVEDVQSGLAVQSLLLHIQERLASGESLSDILYIDPQATRSAWENLGGNSLFFKFLPDGKAAWLKAKGNDKSARDQRYDNLTMKVLPYGAQIRLNGQDYFAFYIANFDPLDAQNPDPLDLANWKFFLGMETYDGSEVFDVDDYHAKLFWKKETRSPWIYLYGDEQYRQNHPFFDALLKIEGNDISPLDYREDKKYRYSNVFMMGFASAEKNIQKYGVPASEYIFVEDDSSDIIPLPYKIQLMLFLFDVRTPF